jgi:hypothetical protein
VRLARILATGLYVFGLSAGMLTLGSGCGGGDGPEVLVPAKTGEPTPEEKQGRMEAIKKAEEQKRKER